MENKYHSDNLTQEKGISEHLSSRLWLIPVIVVVFLIATGVFMYFSLGRSEKTQDTNLPETQQNTSKPSFVVNCGNDVGCLIDKSENCIQSKALLNSTVGFFGMFITSITSYEISKTGSGCILHLKLLNQSSTIADEARQSLLASGMTQDQIKQQEQRVNNASKLLIGKEGICKFNRNEDLTSLLQKQKGGNFSGGVSCRLTSSGSNCTSTGDWAVADCSGEMFGGTA